MVDHRPYYLQVEFHINLYCTLECIVCNKGCQVIHVWTHYHLYFYQVLNISHGPTTTSRMQVSVWKRLLMLLFLFISLWWNLKMWHLYTHLIKYICQIDIKNHIWLVILCRLASVESLYHVAETSACNFDAFYIFTIN